MREEIRRIDKEFNHPFGKYETEWDGDTVETSLFFKDNITDGEKLSVTQKLLNLSEKNKSVFASIITESGEAFFLYDTKPEEMKGIKIESGERIIQ